MASTTDKAGIEPVPDTTHGEHPLKSENEFVLKSSMDNLGYWASIRKFWKVGRLPEWRLATDVCRQGFDADLSCPQVVLVCNLLCIAAGAEGYQITLTGKNQAIPQAHQLAGLLILNR
jgi:hypothetical protein